MVAHSWPSIAPTCYSWFQSTAARLTDKEKEEGLVIGVANTVVDPGAMVILHAADSSQSLCA